MSIDVQSARPSQHDSESRFLHYWIYYDSAVREAVVYEHEPPARIGTRGYDIGPIDLDEKLVKEYAAAKDVWRAVHLRFVAAVQDARGQDTIDWG